MTTRTMINTAILLFWMLCQGAYAGNLLRVVPTLGSTTLSTPYPIALCLTSNVSCQNHRITTTSFAISATAARHIYHGVTLTVPSGYTPPCVHPIGNTCTLPPISNTISYTPPLITPIGTYASYTGTQDGQVYYSTNNGANWSATSVEPASGSAVNAVFATASFLYAGTANGMMVYSNDNGTTWVNSNVPTSGSAVESVFVNTASGYIYVGAANGQVYYSSNGGTTWSTVTTPPSLTSAAVNSLFVVSLNVLYAGCADGYVYYSTDGGTSWVAINGSVDGSAVMGVYMANGILYVNTADEYIYISNALTGGGAWVAEGQTAYRLFVDATATYVLSGTQGGYVFSLSTGDELGFVTQSPINSVFMLT
ncbi:MAG: YCF48-related protein [Gammaproteobacteria bacterium]|nr:YCF48-related protein [Gammaproteobacteria bacterium]